MLDRFCCKICWLVVTLDYKYFQLRSASSSVTRLTVDESASPRIFVEHGHEEQVCLGPFLLLERRHLFVILVAQVAVC